MPLHLVIAAAEPAWEKRLKRLGEALGWRVECARGSADILRKMSASRKGLAVLDWSVLGGAAGARRSLEKLRRAAPHYALILLAGRAELSTGGIALGLSAGADDILVKDVADKALFAKLNAYQGRLASVEAPADVLVAGDLKADRLRRKVFARGPRKVWRPVAGLGRKEFDLLWFFLRNPGMTFERAAILSGVWSDALGDVNPETIDKHVQNLRRKLGPAGRRLETVHGRGYVFRSP